MGRYIIIHGTGGSPEGNWFPWLSHELRHRGNEVIVPRMPTPEGQSLDRWLSEFRIHGDTADFDTTIIGHSIGAVFLLRFLERTSRPIKRSVFVAGLTGRIGIPEYDALNATFVDPPFDWERIRRNAGISICIAGDNDQYVPFAQAQEIADNLQTNHLVIPGGGHLNSETGYTSFPKLIELLV